MTDSLPLAGGKKEIKPRIKVIGVGGAGGNAVNNMIKADLKGVEFVVANTDAQAVEQSLSENRVQLGMQATQGLGAGSHPDVGRAAAEESMEDIARRVEGTNMVFITAGMGGGTGTGAAPVIARIAREKGVLTVGVVTKPFHFEGANRMRAAEKGIEELQQYVDTLIVIPNQNLFRVANEKTTFADAFKMADDVLYSGVRSVTDLMMNPGLINLDFADIRAVMGEMMGKAMMGTGESAGEGRAIEAAEAAISSPLLDDVSMKGAKAVLINVTGGMDMTLFEVDEAANRIREEVDPDANIIFGSTFDETLQGRIRVSCVATGIDAQAIARMQEATRQKEKEEAARLRAQGENDAPLSALLSEEGTATDGETRVESAQIFELLQTPSQGSVSNHESSLEAYRPSETDFSETPKKRSFFDRLLGRHANTDEPRDVQGDSLSFREETPLSRVTYTTPQTAALKDEPVNAYGATTTQEDELDIPAFLRRKSTK